MTTPAIEVLRVELDRARREVAGKLDKARHHTLWAKTARAEAAVAKGRVASIQHALECLDTGSVAE